MAGSTLTIQRGDTLTFPLTGLGSVADRSKLWFALKTSADYSDDAAILLIEETAGLTRVNGNSYASTTNGSITVDDEDAGNLTITVKPAVTSALSALYPLVYDTQVMRTDGSVTTLRSGAATVTADITRAVS